MNSTNDKNGIEGDTAIQIKTSIGKGIRGGWQAKSRINLGIAVHIDAKYAPAGFPAVLKIDTYKGDRGLMTYASVHGDKGDTMVHAIGFGAKGHGDYSERVKLQDVRCTEKTVRAQHEEVMSGLAEIVTRAKAHYAVRDQEKELHARRARELADQDAIAMRERNERPEFDPRAGDDIEVGSFQS